MGTGGRNSKRRLFADRRAAARELSEHLAYLRSERPLVLGLVNGGVPIAETVATALDAPLDLLLIERLTAPKHPDHVVGAVDEHGRISMIRTTARWHHLSSQQMVGPARDVFRRLQRQRGMIRRVLPELDVEDHTVVIVDDGIASGARMLGAIASVRDRGARFVVAAAPAGGGDAVWHLHEAADLVVIPHRPTPFRTLSDVYVDAEDVSDDMVRAVIDRWVSTRAPATSGVRTLVMKLTTQPDCLIACEVDLPPGTARDSGPYPAVIFAHGYESDGRSSRTVPISHRLAKRGIIGVRIDFTGHGRSEGDLAEATPQRMGDDLRRVLAEVSRLNEVDARAIGLVGAGTGGTLVLDAARELPEIHAVVVRSPMLGTELDLAAEVACPTLLIFAENDSIFADAARRGGRPLPSCHQLLEIPEAERLFNDAISLEMMVSASVDWLSDHLPRGGSAAPAAVVTGAVAPEPPARGAVSGPRTGHPDSGGVRPLAD